MTQLELIEPSPFELKEENKRLRSEMNDLRKAVFARISEMKKEHEVLYAHCQVISDELFRREAVSH